MHRIMFFVTGLFIFALATAAVAEDAGSYPTDKCPVCGMVPSMFAQWNSKVEFSDSNIEVFDSAKCMFKYYLDIKRYNPARAGQDVSAISVKDYNSKNYIDARKASFVIWSDVYGPMGHDTIAFEKESDAKEFLKEHKGKNIVRFQDINLKLITELDNP
jgi:copper chaperone NosL